jgi:drug/metabolite transporter (DMT)-like permease
LGVFANQLLFLLGLASTSATTAALWMPTIPLLTAAAATVLGVERLGPRRLFGVLGAGLGAWLLVQSAASTSGFGSLLGNAAIFLNCLSYSFYLVLQRPVLRRLPWRTTVAGAFLGGGVFTLLATGPALLKTPWAELPASTWAGIFWIGLVPTVGAFALNAWAVAARGPSLSAAFTTLQPVLTAISSSFFLREQLQPAQALAGLLIVLSLGIFLSEEPGTLAQKS